MFALEIHTERIPGPAWWRPSFLDYAIPSGLEDPSGEAYEACADGRELVHESGPDPHPEVPFDIRAGGAVSGTKPQSGGRCPTSWVVKTLGVQVGHVHECGLHAEGRGPGPTDYHSGEDHACRTCGARCWP